MIAAPRLTGGDAGFVDAGGDFHRYFVRKFKLSAHHGCPIIPSMRSIQ
jgi:hypothetical protein